MAQMSCKLIELRDRLQEGNSPASLMGVTPTVISSAHQAMELSQKARRFYQQIADNRMVGLTPDLGFDRLGQQHRDVQVPGTRYLTLYPESYSSYILFSILTKLINGSVLYLGDPGTGKTSMAMMMGMMTGRTNQDIKKDIIHGQPQLSNQDMFGTLDLAKYQQGIIKAIFHNRISNDEADLIIDEINRIPTKTQSAILSLLAEKYVELFGEIKDVKQRAIFATANDRAGGGTYDLIEALRDRFEIAVTAYPRNYLYAGIVSPDNTQSFEADYIFQPAELDLVRRHIDQIGFSQDAQRRLQYYLSLLNTAERASGDVTHEYKGHISGSGLRSSELFGKGHDDAQHTLSALIEGTVSNRYLESIKHYARALAWFRGKQQVDTEDIAAIIPAASIHRLVPSPHFQKLDILYKYDAWERSRYLWSQAMERYDNRFSSRPQTHTLLPQVPDFFSDLQYDQAETADGFWDLKDKLSKLSDPHIQLATIFKAMNTFAAETLDGSEGVEELLAMKILFDRTYAAMLSHMPLPAAPAAPPELPAVPVVTVEAPGIVTPATATITAAPGVVLPAETPAPPEQVITAAESTAAPAIENIPILPVSGPTLDPTGMAYIDLPEATVTLGSRDLRFNPTHETTLSDYQISRTVVTQAMYQRVMGKTPAFFTADNEVIRNAEIFDTSTFPVERVNWEEAVEYCKRLSMMDTRLSSTVRKEIEEMDAQTYDLYARQHRYLHLYRLPTEAEWERAAQIEGGTSWRKENSEGRTHSVDQATPNSLGIVILGNVGEWCSDAASEEPATAKRDPVFSPQGAVKRRVVRGRSWNDAADNFPEPVYRASAFVSDRYNHLGFRVVRG